MRFEPSRTMLACLLALTILAPASAHAEGPINKVNHIIILMQENHSFDNYFGALAYAPGTPYHNGNGACQFFDHSCVDGLSCTVDGAGNYACLNSNLDQDGSTVFAFHDSSRCVAPDLDHSWLNTHFELNFLNPNQGFQGPNDGFVRETDLTEQIDSGESPTDEQTITYYNPNDQPD